MAPRAFGSGRWTHHGAEVAKVSSRRTLRGVLPSARRGATPASTVTTTAAATAATTATTAATAANATWLRGSDSPSQLAQVDIL